MKRIGVVALAALFFLAWSPGDASAFRGHRFHHHSGHRFHHHSRVVFHFGWPVFYPAPYYYYPPYYYYGPHYYPPVAYPAPAPAYYAPGGHEFFGTVLGAISGGVIGAQIGSGSGRAAAIAGGILLGSLVGNTIGRQLDVYDRRLAYQSTQYALESMRSGSAVEWRGPGSGAFGTVVPRPAFQNQLGQYCREFQETVVIGGQQQSAYGTACRQDDGQWRIVQ